MIEVITVYWVKILVTLSVIFVLFVFLLRNSGRKSSYSGAFLVEKELSRLNKDYKIFKNLIIKLESGMLQIHYVMVSPHGVFVITRCDHVGKISGNKGDREWNVKARGDNETILNLLWENRKHINALEKRLNLNLPFIPVIVFTYAKLVNDFGPTALYLDQVQKFFARHTKLLVSQTDQESIIALLEE
jgi:transcription antitermination factor NusA-like protein|tara:strand:- start:129 stop:692 length:564 start_codon:yes stop_codon:yes gene_type:complete